ncbi:MAG: hypothetical protein P0Y59_00565 [Candidatus Sphingomonas phytovorans]|nr:hypothetical protein [Sphingomonas sp.]WEK00226.1 MAG: hypothetical protein P0Y59_00565 [Sphingomonas sp.]
MRTFLRDILLTVGAIAATGAGPLLSRALAAPVAASDISPSSWPIVTRMADLGSHQFSAMRRGTFASRDVPYAAELSEMLVHDGAGKPAASMFLTSFVAKPDDSARPVVFLFNGGPGGASNTLMFGAFGPQRLAKFSMAAIADPATPIVANDDTLLDIADLVFIDPPETGYGRPLAGANPKTFRGNDGDSYAVVQAMLRWLHDHHRETSPIYVVGESYGSIRAVLLARDLRAAAPRVELAGMILISQALWYNGPDSNGIARLPDPVTAVNSLPDIAALAWYHGLIDNTGQTLEQAVRAARAYALGDYASAMVAGNRLGEVERSRVARRLEGLTGIPTLTWLAGDLRLTNIRRQLLAGRNLALGQFDGRETEPLQGVPDDGDRDGFAMMLGLTHAAEETGRTIFHTEGLPDYRSMASRHPLEFEASWAFIAPPAHGPELILREQMSANPRLRLMVAQGVFDTTATMGETDYQFSQIGAPRDRTWIAYYAGGHMLYSDVGRLAFLKDVRDFVGGKMSPTHAFPQSPVGTPHP